MINKRLREKINDDIKLLNTEGLLRVLDNIDELKKRYTTTNLKGKVKIKIKERKIYYE